MNEDRRRRGDTGRGTIVANRISERFPRRNGRRAVRQHKSGSRNAV